jgi:hypothetical protein
MLAAAGDPCRGELDGIAAHDGDLELVGHGQEAAAEETGQLVHDDAQHGIALEPAFLHAARLGVPLPKA